MVDPPNLMDGEVEDTESFLPRHVFPLSFLNIVAPEIVSYPRMNM